MNIEIWPVTKPVPYPNNPRKNEAAVESVMASLRAFGFRQPLVVDKRGVVIAGHTRLAAAIKMGLQEVPVHVADLTEEHLFLAVARHLPKDPPPRTSRSAAQQVSEALSSEFPCAR